MNAMTLFRLLIALLLAASLGVNALLVSRLSNDDRRTDVQLQSPDRVEVIRTPGGLLQVSSIKSPETFQATTDHTLLGLDIGETVTQNRVPAVFNYQVELAPEWRVTQERYRAQAPRAIRVFFADESIESLARIGPAFLSPPAGAASASGATERAGGD